MEDRQFYTVDPSTIKQITVKDILTGKGISTENIDYLSPVPTSPIGIPHQNRDMGFQMSKIYYGETRSAVGEIGDSKFEQYRGRFGC